MFKLFESCGDIKAVKLNTFKGKKKCNGQAYITFKNHKQADKAVKKITDKKPEGAAESDGEGEIALPRPRTHACDAHTGYVCVRVDRCVRAFKHHGGARFQGCSYMSQRGASAPRAL